MKFTRSPLVQFIAIYAVATWALNQITPPIPSFVMSMFYGLLFAALMLYVSADEERFEQFLTPLRDTFAARTTIHRIVRLALFIALPLGAGNLMFGKLTPRYTPPAESRTVHPEPPLEITFKGKPFKIDGLTNPLRKDTANFEKNLSEGMTIYFRNCFYCHGDNLDGQGPYADALNPIPANFKDPGTIAQLQESFVFWRIALGWRGLPSGAKPWNSAMPAWEDTLTEEEIWKVILYIYEASGFEPRTWEEHASAAGTSNEQRATSHYSAPRSAYAQERVDPMPPKPAGAAATDRPAPGATGDDHGRSSDSSRSGVEKLYYDKCAGCHGFEGDGFGPAFDFVIPRPRDFTKGLYKVRSTKEGNVPSDADLHRAIADGLPGTTMPPWKHVLSKDEINQLVTYLKRFSPRFELLPSEPIDTIQELPNDAESLERGEMYFDGVECWKCHGREGLGDGPSSDTLKDDWGNKIYPRNLSKPWTFRRGDSAEAMFEILYTGMQGTPMPAFADSMEKPDDLWDMVHYVRTFSMEPKSQPATLLLSEFTENLPTTMDDPQWDTVPYSRFPLLGQVVFPPRNFIPANDTVFIKTFHDGKSISFLVEWHDPTLTVENSTEGDFTDRMALQFPAKLMKGMEKPHFVMGDPQKAVNLWTWNPGDETIAEYDANGVGTWKRQAAQNVTGTSSYLNGRYKLLLTRSLESEDESDLDFTGGDYIPIAFITWDGHRGETEGQASLSAWYHLMLKQKASRTAYAYSFLVGILVLFGEMWVARKAKEGATDKPSGLVRK